VLALALAEGRRWLRHPLLLGGVAGALWVAFQVVATGQVPVLSRDDVEVGQALLALAAAALLVANLAGLRARRSGAEELLEALPAGTDLRAAGLLVSLAWPLALAVVLVGLDLAWLLALGAIGRPSIAELLVGPAAVALAGAIGVLLARITPSLVAGPLAVLGGAALYWKVTLGADFIGRWKWLTPWVRRTVFLPDQVIRPAGWHLAYLIAVALACGVLALLLQRATKRRAAALGLALLLAGVTASMQLVPPSVRQLAAQTQVLEHPETLQVCRPQGTISYCVFPAYQRWMGRWAAPIEGVLARVPATVAARPLLARQQAVSVFQGKEAPAFEQAQIEVRDMLTSGQIGWAASDAQIVLPVRWARASGQDEFLLALQAAEWAVGLPTATRAAAGPELPGTSGFGTGPPAKIAASFVSESGIKLPEAQRRQLVDEITRGFAALPSPKQVVAAGYGPCSAVGQARAVVAVWLAAQATPATSSAFRQALNQQLGLPDGGIMAQETVNLGDWFLFTQHVAGDFPQDRITWADPRSSPPSSSSNGLPGKSPHSSPATGGG